MSNALFPSAVMFGFVIAVFGIALIARSAVLRYDTDPSTTASRIKVGAFCVLVAAAVVAGAAIVDALDVVPLT